MKRITIVALAVLVTAPVFAQDSHNVRGHYRRDGTYVEPHRRTNPDNSMRNNWSTEGNYNPYTGSQGGVDPYRQPRSSGEDAWSTGQRRQRSQF